MFLTKYVGTVISSRNENRFPPSFFLFGFILFIFFGNKETFVTSENLPLFALMSDMKNVSWAIKKLIQPENS